MTSKVDVVRDYYMRMDAGRPDTLDLFTEDVEIYFPKFGVAQGKDAFGQLASGLLGSLKSIEHNQADLRFSLAGDTVVVQGTTRGETADGTKWSGGETPGGRFASVFDFRGDLISRMYIYMDPDYGGHDKARFLWNDVPGRRW